MKHALILGGTGAMGGYLTKILSSRNDWNVDVTSRSHKESFNNIHYLQGNARDNNFRHEVLRNNYDVIVDFMNYGYDEFCSCYTQLLDSTEHYIFLSSSRVYADSDLPITEQSPRLLDITEDQEFLATQRYALRKARQENMLNESARENYTIVRPYITYSGYRLQLGIYEKEQWLYRLLNDKPLVIRKEILDKRTTLTYGEDVSRVIGKIMDSSPLGGSVHIMSEETMVWKDILKLYVSVIRTEIGELPPIYISTQMKEIEELFEGGYNTKYDRLYNRSFNNHKAETTYGHVDYLDMRTGLQRCLVEFINAWKERGNDVFLELDWNYEAIMDSMVGAELTSHIPVQNIAYQNAVAANKEIKKKWILDEIKV